MINFYSETDFQLEKPSEVRDWLIGVIEDRGFEAGEISYVFCDDDYLLDLNKRFLKHDTLTDIISFDDSFGKQLHGEIYISVDRVTDNSREYRTDFYTELHRVMVHGVLHYCGYKDKTDSESEEMRKAEDEALQQRSFV